MKKLLASLFIFVSLAVGAKADALTFSEALLQIQNLKKEIVSLNLKLKGSAWDPVYGTQTTDLTPRISYYSGKVNQHVDIQSSSWVTDADGSSGAGIDKLTYCKKFYPNTTSVADYKLETINTWQDGGNVNNYTSTRMSYKCVETKTNPIPMCDYAQPMNGCEYVKGPDYNSTTNCGMTLACPVASFQCSDGLDNDKDELIDSRDPGCHLNGNLAAEYLPNQNTEVNKTIPIVNSPTVTSITQTSAVLGANILSQGDSAYGYIYYGASPRPSGMMKNTTSSITSGAYNVNVSNLSCGTKYYFYGAYTNSVGTGYSPDETFVTSTCSQVITPSIAVTSPEESNIINNTTETGVIRFNIKAENSDVYINSFKINFENRNKEASSPRLSNYITDINTYWEGIPIGALKVYDFGMISSGLYSKILPVGSSGGSISNNQSKDYYIKVKMNPTFSTDNINNNWRVWVTNIRYTDSTGVVRVSDAVPVSTLIINQAPLIGVVSPCAPYGDVDSDGYLTEKDTALMTQKIGGVVSFSAEQIKRADLNKDGNVSSFDVFMVKNFISGTSDTNTFPVCSSTTTPSLTVLSPNGGETYSAGQKINVKYKMVNNDSQLGDTVSVFLKNVDSNTYNFGSFRAEVVGDDSISITIPSNSKISHGYKILVRFNGSTGYVSQDESDNLFSIVKAPIACMTIAQPAPTFCVGGKIIPTIDENGCIIKYTCNDTALDSTPRISVYQGKVNQHVDDIGKWQTDSDGVSGAELNKLTYCNKFYPGTTSVSEYKLETINTWHDRSNMNNYTSTRMSYKCVGGGKYVEPNGCSNGEVYSSTTGQKCPTVGIPTITVLSPNGGETYTDGQQITITWKTENIPTSDYVQIGLSDLVSKKDYQESIIRVLNSGRAVLTLPSSDIVSGKRYNIDIYTVKGEGYVTYADKSDNLFTITSDTGCSSGQIYSSTTGQKCPDSTISSITVISPNGGTYKTGDSILVKWLSNNLASGNYMRISLTDGVNYFRQDKTLNTGSYSYIIDSTVNSASTYKMVVGLDSSGRDIKDFSDKSFTINSYASEFTIDSTCTGGEIFSSMTGKRCSEIIEIRDSGCTEGKNFSSTTGKPCANGLYKNDDVSDDLTPTTGETVIPITRTLKRGISGDDVKRLQEFLQVYADGVFGRGTAAKVKEWQMKNGLYPDGSFGRMSRIKAGLE